MLCIELQRNGTLLATSGLPGKGVLSVIFDRVLSDARGPKELLHYRLGGLDSSCEPNTHLVWAAGKVSVGDEFTVRFFQGESADRPIHSEPSTRPTASELRRFRRRQLRHLEAEVKKVRALLTPKARKDPMTTRQRKAVREKKSRS